MVINHDLVEQAIKTNGFPEIQLLKQEVEKIRYTNNTTALKKATTKTKNKIEQLITYSNHTGLFLFHKIVYDYLDSCSPLFEYVKGLPTIISKKQESTIFLKYKDISHIDVSMIGEYITEQQTINRIVKNKPLEAEYNEFNEPIQPPQVQELKNLFGEEKNEIEVFADRYYDEKAEISTQPKVDDLDAIIRRKYGYTEGVGMHLKSINDCPLKIKLD